MLGVEIARWRSKRSIRKSVVIDLSKSTTVSKIEKKNTAFMCQI